MAADRYGKLTYGVFGTDVARDVMDRELLGRAAAAWRAARGDDDSTTLLARSSLALLFRKEGRPEESAALHEANLGILRRTRGGTMR